MRYPAGCLPNANHSIHVATVVRLKSPANQMLPKLTEPVTSGFFATRIMSSQTKPPPNEGQYAAITDNKMIAAPTFRLGSSVSHVIGGVLLLAGSGVVVIQTIF